ncbi:hypothetical protein C6P45_002773 [Maudiozyma exigua]|uniref:PXA domain-containing protein n=1 Tax=Maudiozyma exigua TaxID=34358 RepID=A0A9P6WEH6_MAUEX|nr:hypothetical protein C6P45_002773 [Kazachstania exigua]
MVNQRRLSLFLGFIILSLALKLINLSLIIGMVTVCFGFTYLLLNENKTAAQRCRPKRLNIKPGKPRKIDHSALKVSIFPQYKRISEQVEQIIELIIRDFILSWFQRIDQKSESEFSDEIRLILRKLIIRLENNLEKTDITSLVVFRFIPLVSKHFDTYCKARSNALSTVSHNRHNNGDNFHLMTAIEFNNIYRLHKSITLKPNHLDSDIEVYMNKKSELITRSLLDSQDLNSSFVLILCREILSKNLFSPALSKFHDPDKWNCILLSISKKIINERNQVQEVKTILMRELQDKNVTLQERNTVQEPTNFEFVFSSDITTKEFEKYLRGLSSIRSISDLRTGKFLLKTALMKANENSNLNFKKKNDYKNRLTISLGLIDNRLRTVEPSSNDDINSKRVRNTSEQNGNDVLNRDNVVHDFEDIIEQVTFDSIINDSVCLPYFDEFMKLAKNERGLILLNYWKSVEAFKNPLEDANKEDVLTEVSQIDVDNINFITETFLGPEKLKYIESLDAGLVSNIKLFSDNDLETIGTAGLLLARKSMLYLQTAAEEELDRVYVPNFKKSSIFLRMVSSSEFIKTDTYAKYFEPKTEKNVKSSSPIFTRKISVNAVEILASPGLNEALESIIETADNKLSQLGSRQTINDEKRISAQNIPALYHPEAYISPEDAHSDELFPSNNSPIKDNPNTQKLQNSGTSDEGIHDRRYSAMSTLNYEGISDLKSKIGDLTLDTNKLQQEIELLNHLILKAKLTNNTNQLKILTSSLKTLMKEKNNKELLKQQYMLEENATSLYRRTHIAIRSYIIDYEMSNLKEVAYYIINVSHSTDENTTSWEIPRRYTEFAKLHSYLKKKYKSCMKDIVKKELFPSKMAMSFKYQISQTLLYEKRRKQFQIYLVELIKNQDICQDDIFRRFLINTKSFSTMSKEDFTNKNARTLINSNKLTVSNRQESDPHSDDRTDNSIDRLSNLSTSSGSVSPTPKIYNSLKSNSFDVEELSNDKQHQKVDSIHDKSSGKKSFLKPICDLFIAIFSSYPSDINSSNSGGDYWLRGGAIIMLLQQLFGSTIEKYIKEHIVKFSSEPKIFDLLFQTRVKLWGVGGYFETRQKAKLNPLPERTELEKKRAYADSKLLFQALLVELSGKVVGLHHAREAANKIHDILQNPYLNASILLEIFDFLLDSILIQEDSMKE